MIAALLALLAGTGAYFLCSAFVLNDRSACEPDTQFWAHFLVNRKANMGDWLAQAGLAGVSRRQVTLYIVGLSLAGAATAWLLFGGVTAPLLTGVFAGTFPIASYRRRRLHNQQEASEAWPRLIEEIRLLCCSLGRPIPQALLEAGKQSPTEMRAAFDSAEREWLMSTDFERAIFVLKESLADATADAICETLLVANAIGGAGIDRRLAALAEDRRHDLRGRKEAKAKQAGVRFARRFVLIVPTGMALAGLSIGNGKAAYETATGQLGVAAGLVTLAACWWWAGRLIALPVQQRVFRA